MNTTYWVIDQIDGAWVTLSPAPDQAECEVWTLPASLLPQGMKEGDIFSLTLTPEPEQSAALKAQVSEQLAQLTSDDDGGDFSI